MFKEKWLPIFNVGEGRGGDGLPGIFWADFDDLARIGNQVVPQIVGHKILNAITTSGNITGIDIAMYEGNKDALLVVRSDSKAENTNMSGILLTLGVSLAVVAVGMAVTSGLAVPMAAVFGTTMALGALGVAVAKLVGALVNNIGKANTRRAAMEKSLNILNKASGFALVMPLTVMFLLDMFYTFVLNNGNVSTSFQLKFGGIAAAVYASILISRRVLSGILSRATSLASFSKGVKEIIMQKRSRFLGCD